MITAKLPFRNSWLGLSVAALTLSACTTQHLDQPVPNTSNRIIGYYFGPTARRGFPVLSVNGALLTHMNYAFGQILPDGSAALGNPGVDTINIPQILELKQRYPQLKVLISFGGWGGSKYFSEAAATKQSRKRFVKSALDIFFRNYPGAFDGIDLDWEYPVRGGMADNITRPQDRKNLTELVREIRHGLNHVAPKNEHYLITIAVPAGGNHLAKYEMPKLAKLLDFVSLMTYDFHGSNSRIAHFNSPLSSAADDPTPQYNIKASVSAYLAGGLPHDRLVVGVPFYGYGMSPVPDSMHGRFQPVGPRDTTVARPKWTGAVRFYDIKNVLADGFERYWDADASVPYLYNALTHTFVSYDDVESISAKARFVHDNNLGGIMIWELSGDDGTLLPAINAELSR